MVSYINLHAGCEFLMAATKLIVRWRLVEHLSGGINSVSTGLFSPSILFISPTNYIHSKTFHIRREEDLGYVLRGGDHIAL